MWQVPHGADPRDVVADVRELDVKALTITGGQTDVSFLAELRDLEFLRFSDIDGRLINGMSRLRGLSGNSWDGSVDFATLPSLEGLVVAEPDRQSGLDTLFAGHDRLRSLAVGRFAAADLTPLARLPALQRLELSNTRALGSLVGADALPAGMRQVKIEIAPSLASLGGIETLDNLEFLFIASANRVHDITPLAALGRLRYVVLGLTKGIDSLAPLTGHPTLEFITAERILDKDLSPLLTMSALRFVDVPGRLPAGLGARDYRAALQTGEPALDDYVAMAVG
jgi:hypothetical protein